MSGNRFIHVHTPHHRHCSRSPLSLLRSSACGVMGCRYRRHEQHTATFANTPTPSTPTYITLDDNNTDTATEPANNVNSKVCELLVEAGERNGLCV